MATNKGVHYCVFLGAYIYQEFTIQKRGHKINCTDAVRADIFDMLFEFPEGEAIFSRGVARRGFQYLEGMINSYG